MKKNHYKKQVDAAFSALEFLNNMSWTNRREEMFALCYSEEKGHRSIGGGSFTRCHPHAVGISEIARMFTVRRIAEYMNGQKFPSVGDYLALQKSSFYAAALVACYRSEIADAWEGLNILELSCIDYCRAVSPEEFANDGTRMVA